MSEITRIYAQSADVIAKDVDGETVLLDLESSTYFGLNPVGSLVWSLLAEAERSLDEIAQAVAEEYDVDPATAAEDITALASDLKAHGLIVETTD